jgi:hypothetical protein
METQNKTLRELCSEYLDDCKAIAIEALAKDEDERSDFIHEEVDGHEWVIYTYNAKLVSVLTENGDAYLDCYGETDKVTPEQIAYFAMVADINDFLSNPYFIEDHSTTVEGE